MYAVEVVNLTKRFGDFTAVNDLSLRIEPGEVFALVGPNGSGKTTTIKSIVGLNLPTSGEIRIDGVDLKTQPKQAKRLLSFLPQRVSFPENLSARETLEFYAGLRAVRQERVQEVLDQAKFNGFSDRLVGEYSGGMIQRLGLAVASLAEAPILVMDEPTVNLDPEGVGQFYEYITECKFRGKTVLFSSHHLGEVAELADRIAILVKGKIVRVENYQSLMEEAGKRMQMRIRFLPAAVETNQNKIIELSGKLGLEESKIENDELCFYCRKTEQMNILRAFENAGYPVQYFVSAETKFEKIYRKIISETMLPSEHKGTKEE